MNLERAEGLGGGTSQLQQQLIPDAFRESGQ